MYSPKAGRTPKQKHYEVLTELCSSGMKNELTDTNAEEETGQKTVTNNEQQCECCLLFIFSICLSSSGLFLVYTAFFLFCFLSVSCSLVRTFSLLVAECFDSLSYYGTRRPYRGFGPLSGEYIPEYIWANYSNRISCVLSHRDWKPV